MDLANVKRKYPDDPARQVFEAAKSGDAVSLDEVLQDMNSSERTSALETKMSDLFSYGVKNEYAICETFEVTPLIVAAKNGNVECVKVLLNYKADIEGRGSGDDGRYGRLVMIDRKYSCRGCTPFIVAATYGNVNVLSCLIANGVDVNACTNYNCTALMKASLNGYIDAVTFLVECGANIDQQDKDGDTALHYAVRAHSKVAHKLLSLGASQLYNNKGLTALLSASRKCAVSVVEDLITRPEFTKEQRIDALELLGATLSANDIYDDLPLPPEHVLQFPFIRIGSRKGFEYMKRGMEERFADPSHPLLKQSMEPVEAYQNRKESQTLEELAWIEHDNFAINMESLIVRERILGTNNEALLNPIRNVASLYDDVCTELYRHAMKIAQKCNKPCICDLSSLTGFLYDNVWSSDPPRQNDILELLEQTVLEYEKQQKSRRGLEHNLFHTGLFDTALKLVQTIAKFKLCEEGKSSCLLVLLKRLCCLNPQVKNGDTLFHRSVIKRGMSNAYVFKCLDIDTVKLLLNVGFNVNAINNNGDTPLHIAVTFRPKKYFYEDDDDDDDGKFHLLTDMLEVLLDGGAHHDFVNNDGKTPMDMAATDEARRVLSKKRKLELKCISARAVKKFGLPYLGMVPRILEKYISMH